MFSAGIYSRASGGGQTACLDVHHHSDQYKISEESQPEFVDTETYIKNQKDLELHKLGLFADAKRAFYGLIDKYPTDPALYLSLATVLMCQGNLEEAEDTLQTLLQIEPKHDRGHHSLGVVYRQMNRLEESRAHFLLAGSHAQAETVLDVLQVAYFRNTEKINM